MMIRQFFIPVIILSVVFVLYANFPSNQYTAVDGSLRCLPFMNSDNWQLHGNNHMLYPVNVMLWSRIMSTLFGIRPNDPSSFIRMITLMNSFFASIGLVIFFLILKKVTSSSTISAFGTCGLAFSNAFIVNAVNSSEPMVGFAISIASIAFTHAWLNSNRMFLGLIGASLLSLSMAMYQSMFLIAPSMVVLVMLLSLKDSKKNALRNAIRYISFVSISFVIIYSLSHWVIGSERSFQNSITKLFTFNAFEICGRLSPAKFLAVPFALIYGFVHLDNMKDGIRSFFSEQPFNVTILAAIALYILVTILFAALAYISFNIFERMEWRKRIYLVASVIALIVTLFAPIYWSLTYTKILMQPIAASITITALLVSESYRLSNRRISVIFKSALSILFISAVLWNFNNVLLKMHFQPSNLKGAEELAEKLDDESLVILDWDSDIANLYMELYKRPKQQIFCISQEMFMLKRDRFRFAQRLKDGISLFKSKGKKVYFLGVLEKSRSKWRYFLEERLNIDYGLFDEYRRSARLIATFDKVKLYEY